MRIVLSNRRVDGPVLLRELETRIRSGDTTSFISIVPTRRRANLLRRQWLQSSPHASAPRFPVFTLGDFVGLLAEHALPSRRSVTEELQFALLEQAVRAARLVYFKKHHATLPRGTLQTIRSTIIKLKEAGVLPEQLREQLDRNEGRDGEKIADIGLLYDAYEQLLGQTFRDVPGTLLELNTALLTQSLAPMLGDALPGWSKATNRIIVIEGFSEFRKPECAFLTYCAKLDDVTAAIVSDYASGNAALFGHFDGHLNRLQESGFQHRATIEEDVSPWKRLIQNRLFSDTPAAPQPHSGVFHIAAHNRTEEAALVARIVKRLVRERPDRDLSRICVATRLPGTYTTLFREAFADAGIPANITDRFPLAQSAVAVGFIALLDLRLRDFRTRDVARALASPYFTFAHNARPVDGDSLLAFAAQLRIVGGFNAWTERIATRRAMLLAKDDGDDALNADTEIANCARALDDLQLLQQKLGALGDACPAATFVRTIEQVLDECNTARNILAGGSIPVELLERETRAYHALRELISGVCNILADQRDDEPIPLSEYARQIRAAVTVARYNVRPRAGKGVLITSPEETRGLDIDVMIIAGLVDGEFPLPYAPEIFLSKNSFQTSRRRHAQDERYLFYQTATNWTDHLFLTSPEADDTGKDLVQSSFLDALADHVQYDGALLEGTTTDIIAQSELCRIAGNRAAAGTPLTASVDHAQLLAAIQQHVTLEAARHRHVAPAYEGIIGDAITDSQRNDLQKIRERVWSTSQLETYGKCPYRYFSSRLLRLQDRGELEEGLSPQEKGTLIHEILFLFFTHRRDRNAPPLPSLSDAEARAAEEELLEIAHEVIDRLQIQHPFWRLDIDRTFGLAGNDGILRRFIRHERERKTTVEPVFFEVQFGSSRGVLGRSDATFFHEAPVDFGGWKLRGKIDRIDVGAEDVVIVDYKSGKPPKRSNIVDGTSLQLPLYIRALDLLLAEQPGHRSHREIAGGLYYEVQRECAIVPGLLRPDRAPAVMGKDGARKANASVEEYEEYIRLAFEHVESFLNGIGSGDFRLTSPELRSHVCRTCSYVNMCRVRDEAGGLAVSEQESGSDIQEP